MKEAGIIKPIPFSTIESLPDIDEAGADCLLKQELDQCRKKVVVLDDDPTGVQTVHDVSVYTDWEPETFSDGFEEDSRMFFILTNSRGMTAPQTEEAHKKIADGIMKASRKYQKDFILISRSDSTLRGHYPLETEVLREELEAGGQPVFDGEIIYPFFKEGGRYTLNKVHYVKEGDWLVPAGMTEFAKDKSFGYVASDLTEWCEEKTYGKYPADGVVWISITDLRLQNVEKITEQLMNCLLYTSKSINLLVKEIYYVFRFWNQSGEENAGLCEDRYLCAMRRLRTVSGFYDILLFQPFFHSHYKMEPPLLRTDVMLQHCL